MEKNNSRYILLLIILIINTIYSYLFLRNTETIIISFVLFIPVAIYGLKYKIDGSLIFCMLAVCIANYILYGIEHFISYSMVVILPALIISYLVREKMPFTKLISLSSILLFASFLGTIILLKTICDVDVLTTYFNGIDIIEKEFTNIYSTYFNNNTNSIKEYSIAIGTLKNTFYYMKYYYPALLYLLCLGISFISILCISFIANKMKINNFGYENILGLKVSRSIIGFLMIVIIAKALYLNGKSNLMVAIDNILVIIVVLLFFLGILFEMSIIKRVRNAGRRILLILVSVFCLIFFQAYFVVAGFIDSIFQIRVKLNNA
ncbi:hypothetical protein SH1V18_31260 [Vallitalea longa]|uniref:DUF2232 domain-containing protein n=1 Tax=Vallitalea longa TaxID=2936439 RepID=A0A9W6DEX5_9FIRM|nr:DUF2232 domain-containing protein [Vallitalea longa]GKX30646.1 hypothetical protein SH1V18_31260 [Vallitalea longa]